MTKPSPPSHRVFAARLSDATIRNMKTRRLYNAMIDKRPLLIARCADVGDVIAVVNFGRDNKLPIAIRGGGHMVRVSAA